MMVRFLRQRAPKLWIVLLYNENKPTMDYLAVLPRRKDAVAYLKAIRGWKRHCCLVKYVPQESA